MIFQIRQFDTLKIIFGGWGRGWFRALSDTEFSQESHSSLFITKLTYN